MAGIALDDRQRLEWLRLIRSESIGPRTFRALIARFGTAAAALDALPRLSREAGRPVRICTHGEAEREYVALGRLGGRLIALGEPDYPKPLQAIDSAPSLLAVLGQGEVLLKPCIAVVGSRNASAAGQKFTTRLARDLGEAGFVVASGLARGIDTAAHEASLATGTVAVLAGGLDEIYPPQNVPLLERLLERGCAVSEMPLGWGPRGRDFPRRNRLVSGLSLGTVVVEAARQSGSLITARFANEQGRTVFAVPGSPLDPRAEGGNHLIREGATLISDAAHVIEAPMPLRDIAGGYGFGAGGGAVWEGERAGSDHTLWEEFDLAGVAPAPEVALPADTQPELLPAAGERGDLQAQLLNLLGPTPVSIDDLVHSSGATAREVSRNLLELELAGAIERQPGGLLSRVPR
jgi:DNA processing protein